MVFRNFFNVNWRTFIRFYYASFLSNFCLMHYFLRNYKMNAKIYHFSIKVHPHEQKFSCTTSYYKVAQHEMCCGCAKSFCTTDIRISTIFLVNLVQLRLAPKLQVFFCPVKYKEKMCKSHPHGTQRLRKTICCANFLLPGLHSHRDSMRWDENESVKGTFVLSFTFSTYSCLVSKLSERCW